MEVMAAGQLYLGGMSAVLGPNVHILPNVWRSSLEGMQTRRRLLQIVTLPMPSRTTRTLCQRGAMLLRHNGPQPGPVARVQQEIRFLSRP